MKSRWWPTGCARRPTPSPGPWPARHIGEIAATLRRFVATGAVAVLAVSAVGCGSAWAAGPRTLTLTLVRHAQSAGNASGLIDTSTPGPELTPRGWCQAILDAGPLSANHYDGIYASTMIRTQETATPTAQALDEPVTVLPGLQEIEAGRYEGQPEADAVRTYLAVAMRWLQGDRSAQIPGSIDGNQFEARFDDAVQHIYDSGELHPVAFSHAAAIMLWVLMNVHNPDRSLLINKPLPNMGRVVVTGNPSTGWTLAEWNANPPPC
jgi:broad specificity phosphatase PhoE